ncbi:MAG: alpha-L-arabinofuranosidase C-terminal domain-containing protein [Pelobium sp.]
MKKVTNRLACLGLMCVLSSTLLSLTAEAQQASITLDFTKSQKKVSPMLYGLMTEEINHSYDGGLYAELIRNRIFKDSKKIPESWSLVQSDTSSKAVMKLIAADEENIPFDERRMAINSTLTTCLRLTVETEGVKVGVANEGYWGIPIKPSTSYQASFYIKGTGSINPPRRRPGAAPAVQTTKIIEDHTAGPITVTLESNDGKTVYASGVVNMEKSPYWKKYNLTLTTSSTVKPTADARFVISTDRTGLYYFNLVSLFPPTFKNTPNGFRPDLMEMMVDMKPKFLRFPGGNFLEGPLLTDAFPWKTTLGPIENRPGHKGSWGYRASDGMGLMEFLLWCEQINAEPLLGVYAGYSLNGDHVDAGPLLKPYVEDALDEIEYIIGDKSTYWGAKRAQDGHPEPFKLTYVEIGNEDWFDRSGSYTGRFEQFREAIEKKYPQLHCISTIADAQFPDLKVVSAKKPEILDEHYYRNAWEMWENASQYDSYDRNGSKIFVGEWATREGTPTTNLNAALGDAAWMTGMERNSDLVVMSCYAPLFVNVNKGGAKGPRAWQWDSDLIGYDALASYGSPSYYVQKMYSSYLGDKIIPVTAANIPVHYRPLTRRDSADVNFKPKATPVLFYSATMDETTGKVYLKVVNTVGKKMELNINLMGIKKVSPKATFVSLRSEKPDDTNSIENPEKIKPVTATIKGIKPTFKSVIEPYSISIYQMETNP